MVDMTDKFIDAKKLFQNMFATTSRNLKATIKAKNNTGRVLWNSSKQGTYIRSKHGELK